MRAFAIDPLKPPVELGTELGRKDQIFRSEALPELVDEVQLLFGR
jgi:hypothetical protein